MNGPIAAGGQPRPRIEDLEVPERIRRLLESVDGFGVHPDFRRCDEYEQQGVAEATRIRDFKVLLLNGQQFSDCELPYNEDLIDCNVNSVLDADGLQLCRDTAEATRDACVAPYQAAIEQVDREYLASVAQCRAEALECRRRAIRDARRDRDSAAPSPTNTPPGTAPRPVPPS